MCVNPKKEGKWQTYLLLCKRKDVVLKKKHNINDKKKSIKTLNF